MQRLPVACIHDSPGTRIDASVNINTNNDHFNNNNNNNKARTWAALACCLRLFCPDT
jgi:hypothetical protein